MNKLYQMLNPNDEDKEGFMKVAGLIGEWTVETSFISSPDALDLIFGSEKPIEEQEFAMQFEFTYQARRHRKKRINKKWLKRYGFKQKTITSEGWRFTGNKEDSVVEFIKET